MNVQSKIDEFSNKINTQTNVNVGNSMINLRDISQGLEDNKLEKGNYTGNAENLSYHSAGIVSLPIITKEVNGNITLDSTGTIIFGVNGVYIKKTNITGTTLTPLDDTASFIYADYQTGTPAYKIGVDNTIFLSDTTKVPVLRVSRKGTTLHLSKYGETGVNSLEKLMLKDVFLKGFERESGLVLSTSETRKASVSNGVAWFSEKRYILPENLNGTSGTMYEYYLVNGVWTKSSALSLYDSTYYSDGTNRLTLTANRYVAKYFYRDIGDDNEIYYVHGNQYTTLANALAESVPVAPTELTNHSMYVGKIIIQQGATNGTAYPRSWGETLNNTNIQNHDDLANIKQATTGITNGHISDVAQDIYGVKTFKDGIITPETICLTATGSYNIPIGLQIGTVLSYRKINATQGPVSINAQGSEKITPALLTTVTLNSDGDFWILKKVSDSRWDLISGKETGSNSNGTYEKLYNGSCTQKVKPRGFSGNGVAYITGLYVYELTKTLPINFVDTDFGGVISQSIDSANQICIQIIITPITISTYKVSIFTKTSSVSTIYDDLTLIGRWY